LEAAIGGRTAGRRRRFPPPTWRVVALAAILALASAGCRSQPSPRPPEAPPSLIAWTTRVAEYRTMVVGAGVAACLRDEGVEAVELATGRRLWTAATEEVEGRAAADDERVVIGRRRGRELRVLAFGLADGGRRWISADLGLLRGARGFPRPALTGSWLAAGAGAVVVVVRGWHPESVRDQPPPGVAAALVCLDAPTGRERWRAMVPDAAPAGAALPVIAGGTVVLHDGDALTGWDLGSGAARWRQPAPVPVEARRLGGDGVCTLTRRHHRWALAAYAAADGSPRWHCELPAASNERALAISTTLVLLQHETAAATGADRAALVTAVDPGTGRVRWSLTPDPALTGQVTWPLGVATLSGGRAAAAFQTSDPTAYPLYLCQPTTGRTTWRWSAPDSLQELAAGPGDTVLVHLSGYGFGYDRLMALRPPG
jgi:outer membrane protein assembly factor BamB